MTEEIAIRLKPIFKKDFKKARFAYACTIQDGRYWNNHTPRFIKRAERYAIKFHITKELYLDCLETLNERIH